MHYNHSQIIKALSKHLKAKTVLETHVSTIILTTAKAYKIKKAVNFGFLNYETLSLRKKYCALEQSLNKRFTAFLYLGVLPLYQHPSTLNVSLKKLSGYDCVNYIVVMKRFNHKNTLDKLLPITSRTQQELLTTFITQHLKKFSQTKKLVKTSPLGTAKQITSMVQENNKQLLQWLNRKPTLHREVTQQLKQIITLSKQCIPLITQRKKHQQYHLGHGDLHLGNIALSGKTIFAFDGIEFNKKFMYLDRINEIAFLLMDLERRQPALARTLISHYFAITQEYQYLPLFKLYCIYRALVRAKISAIDCAYHETKQYLTYTKQILGAHSPRIILMHGQSGNGKTTIARALLQNLNEPLVLLQSDQVRLMLYPKKIDRYTPLATNQVYRTLLKNATACLATKYSVIIDATFLKQNHRALFIKFANSNHIPIAILSVTSTETLARTRLARRKSKRDQSGHSEATYTIRKSQQYLQDNLSSEEVAITTTITSNTPIKKIIKCLIASTGPRSSVDRAIAS